MTGPQIRSLLCAVAMTSVLTACGGTQVVDQGVAPPPPGIEDQAVPAKLSPIDQLRALTSPEGMSYKPLFEEKLSGDDDRLTRLEEAVEALRIDMDMVVAPAVVKLDAADKAAEAEEAVSEAAAAAPAAVATTGAVKAVRIGEHADKTRIVLDVTSKANPEVSFAHENTQVIVDLKGLAWEAAPSFQAETAKLVSAWKVTDGKLFIDLLNPSTVGKIMLLDPAAGQSAYRLVIDITAKK